MPSRDFCAAIIKLKNDEYFELEFFSGDCVRDVGEEAIAHAINEAEATTIVTTAELIPKVFFARGYYF